MSRARLKEAARGLHITGQRDREPDAILDPRGRSPDQLPEGDPYVKIDEGYARLPGVGYTALHPELEGLDPEDYPDITKLSILGDVAPYSREYNRIRAIVEKQSHGDTELRAHYEQIVEQVRQTKESTLQVDERRFDAPVDQLQGRLRAPHSVGLSWPRAG